MQWLDEKHLNQAEQIRRTQRETWEADNVQEGNSGKPELGDMEQFMEAMEHMKQMRERVSGGGPEGLAKLLKKLIE